MAAVRVMTRSSYRKANSLDISEATEEEGLTGSNVIASSVIDESNKTDQSKMERTTRTRASGRKRSRLNSDEKIVIEEEERTGSKKMKTAVKNNQKTRSATENTKTKDQVITRGLRVPLKKIVYDKKTPALDSSDEGESSSENESGVVSSYNLSHSSSSSSASLSGRQSDSPIPTSELSDSSAPDIDSSTYESSGNEDVTYRIRKSPRKQAQVNSRKKIASLCTHNSDSEESTTSTESSCVSDE